MSDCNMDVVPGSRAPVLSSALLLHVHQLNRDYVDMLAAEHALPAPRILGEALPDKLVESLAALSDHARTALAACSFALYSLGFDDQRFWCTALAEQRSGGAHAGAPSVQVRYGTVEAAPMQTAFCEIALIAAWHTACSQRIAARFLFGMSDEVAARLIAAPLWQVRRIALDYPGLLMPRWPANPAFWPDLVKFAAAGDALRLETARLLGSQLIAAELDASARRPARIRSRFHLRRRI